MLLAALLLASSAVALGDDTVQFKPLESGASKRIGYYMPQRLALSEERPATLTAAPEGLEAARYGVITIAGAGGAKKSVHVVLDEPEGKPARLWVDANGDGDATNDAAAAWDGKPGQAGPDGKQYTTFFGGAAVDIGEAGRPFNAHLSMYRFDKHDPNRAAMVNMMFYYRDYATEGEMTLGGKTYPALLADEATTGDFRGSTPAEGEKAPAKRGPDVQLLIDVNGNGKFDRRGESYSIHEPFNIGGTTYEIADLDRTGTSFRLVTSSKEVAEIPPPPDHSVGKAITAFEATATDGTTVKFPGDYKGKIVLLDFWATWCGPCMREMPNVVSAYGTYHDKGFEILGISLDNDKTIGRMSDVMKDAGMTWRQVADGKWWDAEIAKLYVVQSIPATFLVDGDTGKVIGMDVGGEGLSAAIEKALAEKSRN